MRLSSDTPVNRRTSIVICVAIGLMAVAAQRGVRVEAIDDSHVHVQRAVAEAVRAKIDPSAEVAVTVAQVRLVDGAEASTHLTARAVSGARLGRPTRFTLYTSAIDDRGQTERVGYAVARASVVMPHVRAARDVPRGSQLTPADVVLAEGDIGPVALQPLPGLQQVVGAQVLRPLRAGELVSDSVIRLPNLVRSGEAVRTRVQVGVVTVTGQATAIESGQLGEVVTLKNEASGRRLEGRVVGPGEVEVVQ